jgi:hypothetical protein
MKWKSLAAVIVLIPALACATTSRDAPESHAADLAGVYEVTVELRGAVRNGALRVTGVEGAYGGELTITGLPTASVTGARRDGSGQTVVDLRLPEGTGALHMTFDAAQTFTGELRIGEQRVPVRGRRTT